MDYLLNFISLVTPYTVHISGFGAVFIASRSLQLRKKIHANDIASFATTTGIFFTFLGIVLALGGIGNLGEEANIQQKITNLLGGVFVAFVPSICGAFIAATTHGTSNFWRKPIEENDEQEIDIDAQILQELKRLNTNLVGDSETSLTTRMQKFQLKVTENQDALRKEFQEFSNNVAKNIIDALRKSMADLNEKLGEQFGENFKRFSEAIPKLLEWQEGYRATIENTQQQLKAQSENLQGILDSLVKAQKSFADIAGHVGKISDSSTNIERTAEAITVGFSQTAKSIAQIKIDAEKFQETSEVLTTSIEQQTQSANKQNETIEEVSTSLTNVADKVSTLESTTQKLFKNMLEVLHEAQNSFSDIAGHVGEISDNSANIERKTESIVASFTRAAESIAQIKTDTEQFQKVAKLLTTTVEQQTELARQQMDALDGSATSLNDVAGKVAILDSTAQQLNQHVDALTSAISTITSGLSSVERLSDTLQGKAESIAEDMHNITDENIRELASNLRGISEALVEDYSNVRDAMKEILRQMEDRA